MACEGCDCQWVPGCAQMAAKQKALAALQAQVASAETAGDEHSSRITDMQARSRCPPSHFWLLLPTPALA